MSPVVAMEDQPIDATWFREGRWLTEFVTPDAMEVEELYKELVKGLDDRIERIKAIHQWVGGEVKYKPYIKSTLIIDGRMSTNKDCWLRPSITRRVKVGNCANKAFLLVSLLRQEMTPGDVHVVLGNLHTEKSIGGHAWAQVNLEERPYVIECTRDDVAALIPQGQTTDRYEPILFFNDKSAYAISTKEIMEPFAVTGYALWLKEYLDIAYIEGRK